MRPGRPAGVEPQSARTVFGRGALLHAPACDGSPQAHLASPLAYVHKRGIAVKPGRVPSLRVYHTIRAKANIYDSLLVGPEYNCPFVLRHLEFFHSSHGRILHIDRVGLYPYLLGHED